MHSERNDKLLYKLFNYRAIVLFHVRAKSLRVPSPNDRFRAVIFETVKSVTHDKHTSTQCAPHCDRDQPADICREHGQWCVKFKMADKLNVKTQVFRVFSGLFVAVLAN